jgi:hypothetical protein
MPDFGAIRQIQACPERVIGIFEANPRTLIFSDAFDR